MIFLPVSSLVQNTQPAQPVTYLILTKLNITITKNKIVYIYTGKLLSYTR